MSRSVTLLFLFCGCGKMQFIENSIYNDKYRLQVHYSVPSGWLNDPNGLVYHKGVYHLFYQHYPFNTKWGPMHWGHATSTDLIHWKNLPIALHPYDKGDIFSGCCVVDNDNVTGLAGSSKNNQSIVCVYTLNNNASQTQAIAYSVDDGNNWTQYERNPIIPNKTLKDFRDPNIVKRNGTFYMVLAAGDRIIFYSSKDLKNWKKLSDFGERRGDKSGVWECPSLVSLKTNKGEKYDVLILSENGPSKGSLTQYFVGKFNGNIFVSKYGESKFFWADNGPDNYAGIPYHNDPHGRNIFIGWMSNWLYGQEIPTSRWRGQMTFPRELGLAKVDDQIYLTQRPIDELSQIMNMSRTWSISGSQIVSGEQTIDISSNIPFEVGPLFSIEYALNVSAAKIGKVGLRFSNAIGEYISIRYNIHERIYELNRQHSGMVAFNTRFADKIYRANRIASTNIISGRIILDTASIEVFADDGLNTFSALFFPTKPFANIQYYGNIENESAGTFAVVEKMNVTALNSIWT